MSSNRTIVTEPDPIFGRLTLDSIPYEDPIIMTTFTVVAIGGLGLIGSILYFGKLKYLWHEWLTSVDHKKIGIMYVIVAMIMLSVMRS
jgi:cytochrome o ubiquinol oxidase subunit 1